MRLHHDTDALIYSTIADRVHEASHQTARWVLISEPRMRASGRRESLPGLAAYWSLVLRQIERLNK